MKRLFFILLCAGMLVGCSEQTSKEQNNSAPLNQQEFEMLYTDPDKFKGRTVDFYAKVFTEPEKSEDGIAFQAFADPKNGEKNTIVYYPKNDVDVKNEDILHIKGVVKGTFEGENAFGATLKIPAIEATFIEKTDYITAFSKPLKTLDLNKEINQKGYVFKLNKVEFAKDETRAYITIQNNTKEKIGFLSMDAKMLVGNKQHTPMDNFETGYPEVPTDILPGVEVDAILRFPAIDPSTKEFKFHFEGYSEDFNMNLKPFVFEVKQ